MAYDGNPTPITLTATDADGDDPATFSWTIVASPSNGVLSGTPPDLVYTSDISFAGLDSFTFFGNDTVADGSLGTISLTVEDIVNNEAARFNASDAGTAGHFGFSVSISGDWAIVGSDKFSTEGVYVFEYQAATDSWTEVAILQQTPDPDPNDQFGESVSISGDWAIVGAKKNFGPSLISSGAAYLFNRNGTTGVWEEHSVLRASDAQTLDEFGNSVSINEGSAIVGASFRNHGTEGSTLGDAGAAYVFQGNSGGWDEVAILRASDAQSIDYFGRSVSISGDWAIVGAPGENGGVGDPISNSGAAYLFKRNSDTGSWIEFVILRASNAQSSDAFGISVSISGDRAIVGADGADAGDPPLNGSGAAYVFERDATSGLWAEVAILWSSDAGAGDHFGWSVSINGDRAIVGAQRFGSPFGEGAIGTSAGHAYVFQRTGITGDWKEVAILQASDFQANDELGFSVSISGGRAIVGAPFEDGGEGDPLSQTGAVYFFD